MVSLIKTCKNFAALTPAELYPILQLRSEIFVVEQNCVYFRTWIIGIRTVII